jgi:hypothetical protein
MRRARHDRHEGAVGDARFAEKPVRRGCRIHLDEHFGWLVIGRSTQPLRRIEVALDHVPPVAIDILLEPDLDRARESSLRIALPPSTNQPPHQVRSQASVQVEPVGPLGPSQLVRDRAQRRLAVPPDDPGDPWIVREERDVLRTGQEGDARRGCARLIARKSGVVRTRSPSEENRTASIVGALGDGTA